MIKMHLTNQDMIFLPNLSKTFQLVLFFAFQIGLHDLVNAQPPYAGCGNTNYSMENSLFLSNVNELLISFGSNASGSKFYNNTVGDFPDRVYGLFLCYNYVSNEDCHNCITTASQDVHMLCPSKYEAVVWEEYCQLHYSNKDFFSDLDVSGNQPKYNVQNISDPDRFRSAMNETLNNLTKTAAFDPSASMYATASVPFTFNNTNTVYALVQCTLDLSPDNCSICLAKAITDILDCCYSYIGARLLSNSCYLRYEFYNFYPVRADPPAGSIPNPGKDKNQWVIAILAIGLSALLTGFLVYCYQMRKRTMKRKIQIPSQEVQLHETLAPSSIEILNPQEYPIFDMETINAATDNFSDSNKLGEGGFGPVYKAILRDGKEVAVKRLSAISEQGYDEFVNEVLLIFKLQHKNLVSLLGFCIQDEEKLLVYEYMPNSSLDFFLTDPRKRAQLSWNTRFAIINGIAQGLLYLHQDSRLRIIHRDLKPSNVLLDKDMNPKISDFGTARIFGGTDGEANTAKIAGTFGYMAPEFAMEGLYSIKSDVFSFGVLLLEIITGRRNFVGCHISKRTPSLTADAWKFWNEGRCAELMDPLLIDSCFDDKFLRCMQIGLLCVQEDAFDRPTMSAVVLMLKSETVTLCQPNRPAFSVGRFTDQHETCLDNLSMNKVTISDVLPR